MIETVQRCAAHFATNTYDCYPSVTKLKFLLHWENLQESKSWLLFEQISLIHDVV